MSKFAPWYLYVSEGFGLGRLPVAPGTWGSLGAVLLFIPLHILLPWPALGAVVLTAVAFSFPLCNWASAYMGQWDPSNVVYDELAGMWLTLWPSFWTNHWPDERIWWAFLAGFFLFRFFDITKIFPANIFDGMESGYAITIDDLIAGVYANVALTALGWWMF